MRISSTGMVSSYLQQLNRSYNNYTKLMEQSDGSKLHRPSDDAVAYSKYLRFSNTSAENAQYQTNVKTAISWMKNTDSAMIDIADCMATIVEKSVQAGNSSNGEKDMQAIADEMLVMAQQSVADANAQVGDRYLFSGQMDTTQPYIFSEEKKDRGMTKTLDEAQHNFFGKELKSDGANQMSQMLSMTGSDGNTYYLNTTNGQVYTKEFVDSGYKDIIAGGRSTAAEEDIMGTLGDYASDTQVSGDMTRANTTAATSDKLQDVLFFSMEPTDPAGGYKIKETETGQEKTVTGTDTAISLKVSDGTNECTVSFTYDEIAGGATLADLAAKINTEAGTTVQVEAAYDAATDSFSLKNTSTADIYGASKISIKPTAADAVGTKLLDTMQLKEDYQKVSDYFDANGVINDKGKTASFQLNNADGTKMKYTDKDGNEADLTLTFDTVSQYIVSYQGDTKRFSMVKENGSVQPASDTVNVTGETLSGTSLFDNALSGNDASGSAAFNDILTVVAMTESGDTRWVSSDGITLANNSYNTVNTAETKLAARQQVYAATQTMLDKQSTYITSDISDVADTDVAKLAVQLMSAQTIYNLSLSVGARILPSSLADYLN